MFAKYVHLSDFDACMEKAVEVTLVFSSRQDFLKRVQESGAYRRTFGKKHLSAQLFSSAFTLLDAFSLVYVRRHDAIAREFRGHGMRREILVGNH